MDESLRALGMTRRGFVRTIGMAAGGMALASLPGTMAALQRARESGAGTLEVAVLVPRPVVPASAADSLLAGLNLSLSRVGRKAGDLSITVVPQVIAPGPAAAVAATSALIAEGRADAVVGMLNPGALAHVRDLLERAGRVLITTDGGANVVRDAEQSAQIFHQSLGYWQSNWAMGDWLARNLGRRGFLVSSLYESGFDARYAFQHGFEAAGGTLLGSEVSHILPGDAGLTAIMSAIRAARPDFVYGMFSGADAVDFVQAYAAADLRGIPLAGSAFLVDEAILARLGPAAAGVLSALPWAPTLDAAANRDFAARYRAAYSRDPGVQDLLGYDTGEILQAAATASRAGGAAALAQALGAVGFASPRGPLTMSPDTRTAQTPVYLREVRQAGGALVNAVVAMLASTTEVERRAGELRSGLRSGWTHSYLGT